MKIQLREGKFDPGTCTTSKNLTENGLAMPQYKTALGYTEQRMISTMIVDAGPNPYNLQKGNSLQSKIGTIPKDKEVGATGYRYRLMGRIEQRSEVVAQIGTTAPDGSFVLRIKDRYINKGCVVVFRGGFQAWVPAEPTGTVGNWIYRFQNIVAGASFDFATHVGGPTEPKFCFAAFTAFSEASLRGYGNNFNPDEYIQHMSIQRAAVSMTGSALSDIIWAYVGGEQIGWFFKREREEKLRFNLRDEYSKWFAKSSMKGINGELLLQSAAGIDPETGFEVILGDGIIEQISGANDLWGSGVDGDATIEDFQDMMSNLTQKSNAVTGKTYYVVTGTYGYENAQRIAKDYGVNQLAMRGIWDGSSGPGGQAGGPQVTVGMNFIGFDWAGDSMILIKHPLFDDKEKFFDYGSDGKLLQSSMYVFLDASVQVGDGGSTANIEILSKGGNGVHRRFVDGYLNGLTGWAGKGMVTSRDSVTYEMLKEDMIVIYNTQSCGIIRKLPKVTSI